MNHRSLSLERGTTIPADVALIRKLDLSDERGITGFGEEIRRMLLRVFANDELAPSPGTYRNEP